jgi:hypothetical protein
LDGHSSRLSPALWRRFADARVDVLCLPAHSTHLLQPLDRFVNAEFNRQLRVLQRPPGKRQQAKHLLPFLFSLSTALRRATDPELIALSFAAAGIVPLDPRIILEELPEVCPPYARAPVARVQRLNINGALKMRSKWFPIEPRVRRRRWS